MDDFRQPVLLTKVQAAFLSFSLRPFSGIQRTLDVATVFSNSLKPCPFYNAFKSHDFSFNQQPSLSRQIQSRQQQQHHQAGACGGEEIA